jgi:hypothetical protein
VNATGMAMAILSGSPGGILMGAGGYIANIYAEQRARMKSNDWGESVSDSRYAMVEDGGVFYPAILRSRLMGEGLFDDSNQVTLTYGRESDFYLAADNTGKVRGHFAHPKTRNFRMSDNEYGSTGFKRANEIDPYRQYYFLDDAETVDMLSKYGTADFSWKEKDRDVSDYTDFMKFEQDFISILDVIRSRADPFDDPTLNTIPASKSFRHSFNNLKQISTTAFHDPDIRGGLNSSYPTDSDTFGVETWYDSDDQWWRPSKVGMEEWYGVINEYLPRQMEALYRTRGMAATEMGMKKKYYVDWNKDLKPAENVDQLREQYAIIDGYKDRTTLERNYLIQKASTRAMMWKVGRAGYAKRFADKTHTENPMVFGSGGYKKVFAGLKGLLPSYSDVYDIDELPAYLNKDEDGVPAWMPLDTDRRKKQVGSGERMATFITDSLFYDPNDKISEFGEHHSKTKTERDKVIEVERAKTKQELTAPDVGEIPFNNIVKTGKRAMNRYWGKVIRRRQKKLHMLAVIKEYKTTEHVVETHVASVPYEETTDVFRDVQYDVHGNKVTLEMVYGWIADPTTSPEIELQEPSLAHFYQTLLENKYSWAPKDLEFDERLLPTGYLKGIEGTFKTLLENLDPKLRQRADRIHNEVHKPETSEYLQQHRAVNPDNIAKDSSGTLELFSDWELPYDPNLRKVTFNNRLHTQMSFGPAEEV